MKQLREDCNDNRMEILDARFGKIERDSYEILEKATKLVKEIRLIRDEMNRKV